MTKPYKTKKEKVYYQLREEIIRGEIPPGERLTIAGIAEKCGVSEIPVREAVQQLLQESYLISAPRAGLTVSVVSEEDVRKTFELRAALESLAARLSVRRMEEEQVFELYKMIKDSRKYYEELDYHAYWLCNQAFHRYIYQFCGNERLLGIIDGLMQYSHRYPQYYTNAKQISRSIDRHLEIAHAISDRDERLTEDLVRAQLVMGCKTVQERVREARRKLMGEEAPGEKE